MTHVLNIYMRVAAALSVIDGVTGLCDEPQCDTCTTLKIIGEVLKKGADDDSLSED